MKTVFLVHPICKKLIRELPGSWPDQDLKAILNILDYHSDGNLSGPELRERCLLALAELKPLVAAVLLLDYRLRGRLTGVQIQNLAREMSVDKMWEEYPDRSLHKTIYQVNELLYAAFKDLFPIPTAFYLELNLELLSSRKGIDLTAIRFTESIALRLLADSMDRNSLLWQLFSKKLLAPHFTEAQFILWQCNTVPHKDTGWTLQLIGSSYWLEDFQTTAPYKVTITDPYLMKRVGAIEY